VLFERKKTNWGEKNKGLFFLFFNYFVLKLFDVLEKKNNSNIADKKETFTRQGCLCSAFGQQKKQVTRQTFSRKTFPSRLQKKNIFFLNLLLRSIHL